MKRTIRLALMSAYVLAGASTLAFGARPVEAAPAVAAACVLSACQQSCWDAGYDKGRCTTTGDCVCSYAMCGGQIC